MLLNHGDKQLVSLESCPALVLNADFKPLSYFPLSLWSWQDVIKAVYLERIIVIEEYDRLVHSTSAAIRLPSVISLKEYIAPGTYPNFTRFNLFLRDRFTCQYCGFIAGNGRELTFDHVIPRRLGGKTSWENITSACPSCNLRKGGRTPERAGMHLYSQPRRPTVYDIQNIGRSYPPNYLHDSWRDFLYWDSELDR
ncbi:MAG: HNH endonuclease [Emcibacter sp.]|nr:HNH endonuclease [Emcibacter sp.]